MTFRRLLLRRHPARGPCRSPARAQPVDGLYLGAGAGLNFVARPQRPRHPRPRRRHRLRRRALARLGLRQRLPGRDRGQLPRQRGRQHLAGNLAPVGAHRRLPVHLRRDGERPLSTSTSPISASGQSTFQPYVGVGVGYAWTEWRNIRGQSNRAGAGGAVIYADDTDAQFAYQAILGVGTPLTWLGVTGLSLTAEYRFFGTLQPNLDIHAPQPGHQRGRGRRQARARTTTTTRSCSACATRCSSRRRRRRPSPWRPAVRPRPRRAPTWSSSTGIAPT